MVGFDRAMTNETARAVPAGMARNCSIELTLDVLSDKWSFLVVREAFFGAKRFNELGESLQCSRATLSRTLQELVAADILRTEAITESGGWKRYALTQPGLDLYQVFVSLLTFGDRWLWTGTPPVALFHYPCRCWMQAISVWTKSGEPVDPHYVTVTPHDNYWVPDVKRLQPNRRSHAAARLSTRPDSVERALGIIGDRWTFLLLREFFHGNHRFDEFGRNTGMAPNILSNRLKTLIQHGLVTKTEHARSYYRLSESGLDLYPALIHMKQWGDKWRQTSTPVPLTLIPAGADEGDTITLICSRCRTPVEARQVGYLTDYRPRHSPSRRTLSPTIPPALADRG